MAETGRSTTCIHPQSFLVRGCWVCLTCGVSLGRGKTPERRQ